MVAFSDIIDFLLRLLSDETARADFEKDPQASLGKAGLEGVSAQDVRDARLQLADSGAVHATDDGGRSASHHHDPVREIGHTTDALRRDGVAPAGVARRHVLHDRRPRQPVLPVDLRQRHHGDRRPQRQHRARDPGQRRQRLRRRRHHRRRRVVQLRQRRGRDPGQRRQRGRLADRRRRDRRRDARRRSGRRRPRGPGRRPGHRPGRRPGRRLRARRGRRGAGRRDPRRRAGGRPGRRPGGRPRRRPGGRRRRRRPAGVRSR